MLVLIRWQGRTIGVPLSQLAGANVDESTAEAIADWHSWVAQGYSADQNSTMPISTNLEPLKNLLGEDNCTPTGVCAAMASMFCVRR